MSIDDKKVSKDESDSNKQELSQDDKSQILKRIIVEQLGISLGIIDDTSDLRFDLGADSLDKAEILAKYEKKANIIIPKEEYPNINKVKDILKL